jgi:hypothetical protein
MTKDNQELFVQFAREAVLCSGNLNKLQEVLAGVAYCYHISAVEAEVMTAAGNGASGNTEKLTLFERENAMPVGEPVKYVFDHDYDGKAVIYVYADEKPFSEDEKAELEMFSIVCSFVLEKRKIYGC